MKKITILFVLFFTVMGVSAQYLAAYIGFRDDFLIFDNGKIEKFEDLPVVSFEVGGNAIAYVAHGGLFRIYYDGIIHQVDGGEALKYKVTDDLVVWSVYEILKVFDHGIIKRLSTRCTKYVVMDSLVVFYDAQKAAAFAYYKGEIMLVEDGLLEWPFESAATSDNIMAYITTFNQKFKILYHGEVLMIKDFVDEMKFDAGRDVVAYVDIVTQEFKIFSKGQIFDVDIYEPRSFKAGDEFVAYIDNLGDFKVFENGETTTILSFTPVFYDVRDRIIVFHDQGWLKIYCDGQIKIVERYIPKHYKYSENTIAYIDENSNIKAYSRCKPVGVTREQVNSLELYRDLIYFHSGVQSHNIYFMGHLFEY